MSGLALVFHRGADSPHDDPLPAMLEHLRHRGRDGERVRSLSNASLGFQSFQTTLEERGDEQPLFDSPSGLYLLFDGRLDERAGLGSRLGFSAARTRKLSDAALVLAAYLQWGRGAFEKLLGPFALAIYDQRKHSVICARDPLGSRTLFFFLDSNLLLLATEERAILAHQKVSGTLDRRRIAEYFSLRIRSRSRTFFKDIHELAAGEFLEVEGERVVQRSFWSPQPIQRIRYRKDSEYGEHFKEVLGRSVISRLRSQSPPALLLSGGLDSSSIAVLASRYLEQQPHAVPLTTFSWVFDKLPGCDEREYLDVIDASIRSQPLRLDADGAWPLRDKTTIGSNPSTPEDNPYRELKTLAYEAAVGRGHRVLLDGVFGDQLYSGGGRWLLDLLREGRLSEALRGLLAELKQGPRRALSRAGLGTLLARVNLRSPPSWLTPQASKQIDVGETPRLGYRPEQEYSLLGPRTARGATVETFHAQRHGIELRHPYRDLRLVKLMLAVPAHQLYRHGLFKWILRQGLKESLPLAIRRRTTPSDLTTLFKLGLVDREISFVRSLLMNPKSCWGEYVQKKYALSLLDNPREVGINGVLLWQCVAFEIWRQRHSY